MNINVIWFWLPMILIAFANATLRQFVFIKQMNELRAHQLSTLTLILLCAVYISLVFPYLQIHNQKQALLVGIIWVGLTVAFEFMLGRLTKKSWTDLFQQYNLMEGHVWPIFLICLLILPFIFYRLYK